MESTEVEIELGLDALTIQNKDSLVAMERNVDDRIHATAEHEEPWNKNSDQTKDETNIISTCDREIFEEQQYWQMYECISKKRNGFRLKQSSTPKITDRQLDIIAYQKTIARTPSFYNFDRSTTLVLEMLINKNIVGQYNNIVYKGQNCVVIHAHRPYPYRIGFAVKVYYRLSNDTKNNNAIFKRVQREYDNLLMLEKSWQYNFVYAHYKYRNIIVTDFVGDNQECAPSINTVPPERFEEMYDIMVWKLKVLYNEGHLVHGNMSSKNILYCEHRAYYIGWSHLVPKDHPKALKKLIKDCYFVTKFYERRGVPVKTIEQLFKDVTGLNSISNKVLDVIYNNNNKDLWREQQSNPNRNDYVARKPSRSCRFK